MKIVLYAHGGSKNHGCEAIVRSTISLLKNQESPVLLSYNIKEDKMYNLNEIVNLQQEIGDINRKSLTFFKAYISQKITGKFYLMDALQHKGAIDSLPIKDAALFIGGDNYCYSNVKNYRFINNYMQKKVNKMILWGVSVEPELLNDKKIADDIARFDMIFARESISYNALKKINQNTYLYPDPAFYLDMEKVSLPEGFETNNTVGINVSPMIIEHERDCGLVFENYSNLIKYLLYNTGFKIALIPHVIWDSNDDRKPLKKIYDKFKDSGRIILIEDHNCMQQKYIISKCRFFLGARTHSTIAAYSSCVPTLVLGYSVKARGIARDLFGNEDNYVVSVQNLKNVDDLTTKFQWIIKNENKIKKQLKNKKEEYIKIKKYYAKELYEDEE